MQHAGRGSQRDAGVGRHGNFIIHPSRLGTGLGQEVAENVNAVSALRLVDLHLVGMQDGDHDDLVACAALHGNRSILVRDRNDRA